MPANETSYQYLIWEPQLGVVAKFDAPDDYDARRKAAHVLEDKPHLAARHIVLARVIASDLRIDCERHPTLDEIANECGAATTLQLSDESRIEISAHVAICSRCYEIWYSQDPGLDHEEEERT